MEEDKGNEMIELQRKDLDEIYEELSKMNLTNILSIKKTFFNNLKIRSTIFIRTLSSNDKYIADKMKEHFDVFYLKIKFHLDNDVKFSEVKELREEWNALFRGLNPDSSELSGCSKSSFRCLHLAKCYSGTNFSNNQILDIKKDIIDVVEHFYVFDPNSNFKSCAPDFTNDVYFAVETSNTINFPLINYKERLGKIWNAFEEGSLITDVTCLVNLARDPSNFYPMEMQKQNGYYELKMIEEKQFWENKIQECAEYYSIIEDHLENIEKYQDKTSPEVHNDKEMLTDLKEFLKTLFATFEESHKEEDVTEELKKWKLYCSKMETYISKLEKYEDNMILLAYSMYENLVALNDILHLIRYYKKCCLKNGLKPPKQNTCKNFKCCTRLIDEKVKKKLKMFYSTQIDEFTVSSPYDNAEEKDEEISVTSIDIELKKSEEFQEINVGQETKNYSKLIELYGLAYLVQANLLSNQHFENRAKNFGYEVRKTNAANLTDKEKNASENVKSRQTSAEETTKNSAVKYCKIHLKELPSEKNIDIWKLENEAFLECELGGIKMIKLKFINDQDRSQYLTVNIPLEECLSSEGKRQMSKTLKDIDDYLIEIKKMYDELSHDSCFTLAITKPPSASNCLEFFIKSLN